MRGNRKVVNEFLVAIHVTFHLHDIFTILGFFFRINVIQSSRVQDILFNTSISPFLKTS